VISGLQHRGVPTAVLHSGQHYDRGLNRDIFEALGLAPPDHNLGVGSGSHGEQSARILQGAAEVFRAQRPGLVLVQGDTNTAMAAALAAVQLGVRVGHVEAGLRSFDRRMPEERNRILIDHLATDLYAPTATAAAHLREEGITRGVHITGNTIADVVLAELRAGSLGADRLAPLDARPGRYLLLTAHRPENVDTAAPLGALMDAVDAVARSRDLPALFPCHPRTRARLGAFGLRVPPSVRVLPPLGLHDFLALQRHARLVLTDSGGVQEEACILGVPCVTLRESTERPETVDLGANRVTGLATARVLAAVETLWDASGWEQPFGSGDAGEQIAAHAAEALS